MTNNERLLPEFSQLRGIEPSSRPVELRVQETGNRPTFQKESDMLAFADSLEKFASGTLTLDRAARLQGQEQAKNLYLQQKEQNKKVWNKLTDKAPLMSRINPYTRDYYNDLVAEQLAQSEIAQMQLEYTKTQMATKNPDELEGFFSQHKENLTKKLKEEGLAPSNAIKAIESFETAKTVASREYLPANAEYNYQKGLGVLREKMTTELLNLDTSKLQPADKIKAISSTIQKLVSGADDNGIVTEDITKELGNSLFNYVSSTLDDDIGVLDEKELLTALKEVKIGNRSLNEIVPNFDVQIKDYIDKAQDTVVNRAMRANKLEKTKIDNAFTAGTIELGVLMDSLSGEPTSSENSPKIKQFIETLSSRDPYFKVNKGAFYQFVYSQNKAIESYNDQFAYKGLVADYIRTATFNPNAVSMSKLSEDYKTGKIDSSSFRLVLGALKQAKEGALNSDAQILGTLNKDQMDILTKMDNLDPEYQKELLNNLNSTYLDCFGQLTNPYKQNPNALNIYNKKYNELTTDIEKKNAEFIRIKKANVEVQNLNHKIDKSKPLPQQGMFKSMLQYTAGLPMYGTGQVPAKQTYYNSTPTNIYKANEDVSKLINRPVSVTSPYGKQRSNGSKHGGVDYAASNDSLGKSTLVVNVAGKGRIDTGYDSRSGKFVRVTMTNNPNCAYYVMHLGSYAIGLKNGMTINGNTPLGFMGNTGHVEGSNGSDGTHTHIQYTYKNKVVSEAEWRKKLGI